MEGRGEFLIGNKKLRVAVYVLFGLYLIALAWLLFFAMDRGYENRAYRYNLVLFKEIRRFLIYWRVLGLSVALANLLGNIVIFIPFGFILPIMNPRFRSLLYITLLSFEFSFLIEILQLLTRVGSFDVDDMLLNTLGGVTGYLIFAIWRKIHESRNKKEGKKF